MLATICHMQDMSQGLSHDGNTHKLHRLCVRCNQIPNFVSCTCEIQYGFYRIQFIIASVLENEISQSIFMRTVYSFGMFFF